MYDRTVCGGFNRVEPLTNDVKNVQIGVHQKLSPDEICQDNLFGPWNADRFCRCGSAADDVWIIFW